MNFHINFPRPDEWKSIRFADARLAQSKAISFYYYFIISRRDTAEMQAAADGKAPKMFALFALLRARYYARTLPESFPRLEIIISAEGDSALPRPRPIKRFGKDRRSNSTPNCQDNNTGDIEIARKRRCLFYAFCALPGR
jgi:hypothetical protein